MIFVGERQEGRAVIYHKDWGGHPVNSTYFNNLIINKGSNNYCELSNSTTNRFSHNALVNDTIRNWPERKEAYQDDTQLHMAPQVYNLLPGSPLIGSGTDLIDMPDKDYYGNAIDTERISIGIYQKPNL